MDKVRYIKLRNSGAFVARMRIYWDTKESKAIYEPGGYHDICCAAERTIDLTDTNIPEGANVTLVVYVVAGGEVWSRGSYTYDKACGKIAEYEVHGTTGSKMINLVSYK